MSRYTDKRDVEDLLRAANLVRMVAIRRNSAALHDLAGAIVTANAALDPDDRGREVAFPAFVAVGANELEGRPKVSPGNRVRCKCGESHELVIGAADHNEAAVLFYTCRGRVYLGAIAGRLLPGVDAGL